MILPDDMKKSFTLQTASFKVDLPLDDEKIFCGTCHNPHEKGVIQREAAGNGAGKEHFLRLNGGYDLCVVCHYDKRIIQRAQVKSEQDLLKTPPKVLITHKPVTESKCKICHAINVTSRAKPKAVFLCFKNGCHKSETIEGNFTHQKSVLENCYFCHESHTASYKKLLRVNEEKLCRTCHPLIRSKPEEAYYQTGAIERSEEHTIFTAYLETTEIPRGNVCGFCHNPQHKAEIGKVVTRMCSDCHIFINQMLSASSSVIFNVHQTFKEQPCSACHGPHAGKHRFQLKNPPDTYLQ
jgi:predicted CXXCH cytochrome family protein